MNLIHTSLSNDWDDAFWAKWDNFLTENPSAYLDSRSVKAALDVPQRVLRALCWLDHSSNILGVATTEDTAAVSQSKGQFLKADRPVFKLAQRYLYRGDGKFKLNIRVLGMVLSSGDHAFRFSDNLSKEEIHNAIDEAVYLRPLPDSNVPRSILVKDHYSELPWEDRFAGKSNWHPKWVDLEFDPVMEIDLKSDWKSFEDYSNALRKKSRTKIRKIFKSSEELVQRDLSLKEVISLSDELYDLYSKVYGRAGFQLGKLHKEDIISLKKHWGVDFPVIGYYFEGNLVGFQCGIVTHYTVEAFFVGFNEDENRVHAIYQRMLLEFVTQGIERGSSKISLGRTALDIKSSLGATPRRLSCHMRVNKPAIHFLLRVIAGASSPKIPQLKRAWKDDVIQP
jgi:hypothetical protein